MEDVRNKVGNFFEFINTICETDEERHRVHTIKAVVECMNDHLIILWLKSELRNKNVEQIKQYFSDKLNFDLNRLSDDQNCKLDRYILYLIKVSESL